MKGALGAEGVRGQFEASVGGQHDGQGTGGGHEQQVHDGQGVGGVVGDRVRQMVDSFSILMEKRKSVDWNEAGKKQRRVSVVGKRLDSG